MDKIVYETQQFDIAVTRKGKVVIVGDPVMDRNDEDITATELGRLIWQFTGDKFTKENQMTITQQGTTASSERPKKKYPGYRGPRSGEWTPGKPSLLDDPRCTCNGSFDHAAREWRHHAKCPACGDGRAFEDCSLELTLPGISRDIEKKEEATDGDGR